MGSHPRSASTQSKEIEPPSYEGVGGEAMFYKRGESSSVYCQLCFRRCFIPEGRSGFCRVRENRAGILRSLVYGRPSGLQIDPIELEPMYHMVPGHKKLIERTHFMVLRNHVKDGFCPFCKERIPGIWD